MTHPLAVLVPEVGVLSETFLDWDCNALLPGRTAVISDPPPGGETVRHEPRWATTGPRLALTPVPDDPPPSFARQAAVASFLHTHGSRVLLVQYLDLADRWFQLLHRLPIPVWVRGHGADLSARLSDRYRRLADLAGIIVPTRAAADRLTCQLLPADRIHVVPNHVDVPAAPPPSNHPDDPVVRCLTVGRLVEKKGHAGLVRAFAAARARDPRLRLDVVGGGPLRSQLEDLVEQHGLVGAVQLRGALPPAEVLSVTGRSDLYLQPSITAADGDVEGQPLAMLQAMAVARPCIVSRHEGMTENLTDGHDAWLVDENDADQLAYAIATLAAQPGARRRLGRAAWRVARARHSHRVVRPRLLQILGLEAPT